MLRNPNIPKNRIGKLFEIVNHFILEDSSVTKLIEWNDLPLVVKDSLGHGMNQSVAKSKADYLLKDINGKLLCLARYYETGGNISATYLVYGDEVIHSTEN